MTPKHDDKSRDEKIDEMYTLFTDDNFGFAKIIKRHDKTLYGNGLPGLCFQVAVLWICVVILAIDNPFVSEIISSVIK